ncbi:hypothetical protein C9374_012445 [Naegleria lovaniensis]|uniref:LisH domain-containing protein n=1 Tax=Naegleria lovaniensis TaxID=51637 RepID=A0AA88GW94_NAELO|nr:uncharacterized protein C9374_012445 [Naegleria lovaniensis]KAG2392193.1 hypothetical protein C9374_012445 [Naegleria lovaniensis]
MHSHHHQAPHHHHRRKKHSSLSSSNSSLSFHQTEFDFTNNAVADEYEYQNPSDNYDFALRKAKTQVSSYHDPESSRMDQDPALYSPSLSYSSVSSGRSSLYSDTSKRKNVLDELSEEDLKKKMYKKYKDKGVIGLLKTQLRSMIYEDLTKKNHPLKEASITVFGNRPELQRACERLVLDHLKKNGYSFTASVFTSEANLQDLTKNSEYDVYHSIGIRVYNTDIVKENDIADIMDQDPNNFLTKTLSEMYYSPSWKGESALVKFLTILKQIANRKTRNESCQTEEKEEFPMETKLKMIDAEYEAEMESDKRNQSQTLEQKYLEYQRECERRANEELKARLKMFEETTISAMRLEESAKYRERLARELEEMEKAHMRKMERATEREREIADRLEKKEKEIEKLSYEHRQKMFKEMEEIQRKNQAIARERQLLEMKKAEIDDKARRLDVLASQTSMDMKSELSLMRANLERENITKVQKLEEEKRRLDLEKEKLSEMMKKHSDASHLEETIKQYQHSLDIVKSELHESRKRIRDLEEMNDQMRMQLSLVKESNNDIKPVTTSIDVPCDSLIQRENEDLRNQLKHKEIAFNSLQDKMLMLERSEKHLKTTLEENEREKKKLIEDFKRELLEEKQKTKKYLMHWQNTERNAMVEKLQKERVRTERMQRDLEEQYLQNRTLQHEIDRLRNLLELPRVSSADASKFGDLSQLGKPIDIAYPSSLRDDNIYERLSLNEYPPISIHDKLKEIDKMGMSLNRDFNLDSVTANTQKNRPEMNNNNTTGFTPSMLLDDVSSSLDDSFLKTFDSKTQLRNSVFVGGGTMSGDGHRHPASEQALIPHSLEKQYNQKGLYDTTDGARTTLLDSSPLVYRGVDSVDIQAQRTTLEEPRNNTLSLQDVNSETVMNSTSVVIKAKEVLSNSTTNMDRVHYNDQEIRASSTVMNNPMSLQGETYSVNEDMKRNASSTDRTNSLLGEVKPMNSYMQQDQQLSTSENARPVMVDGTKSLEETRTINHVQPVHHENSQPVSKTTNTNSATTAQLNSTAVVVDENNNYHRIEEHQASMREEEQDTTIETSHQVPWNQDALDEVDSNTVQHEEEEQHIQHSSVEAHQALEEEELQDQHVNDPIVTSNDQQVYDHFGVGEDDDLLNTTHSEGWKSDTSGFSAGGFNDDDLDIEDQLYAKSEYDDF